MIEFNVLRDFEWHRDKKGYRLVIYDKKWVTISNGERSDSIGYRPFAGGGDLCAAFAAVSTPDRLLRFVNDHGPLKTGLRRSEDEPVVRYPTVSPVDSDLKCAEEFREVLRLKAQGRPKKLASYFEGYWHSVGRVFLVGIPSGEFVSRCVRPIFLAPCGINLDLNYLMRRFECVSFAIACSKRVPALVCAQTPSSAATSTRWNFSITAVLD